MAKNTYHEFTLYCTPLNCYVLVRTHDGIYTFITILFHPKLDQYVCKEDIVVFQGSVIENESVLEGYKKDALIITTTFLSTSKKFEVAKSFSGSDSGRVMDNKISLLCKYNLHNYQHTALDIEIILKRPDDDEILIYPYVPFRIASFTKKTIDETGKQQINAELEEIGGDEMNGNIDSQSVWTISTVI